MRVSLLSQASTADGNLVRTRRPATTAIAPLIADRYELRQSIGSGGMGSVFAAFDRVHQRKVALKLTSAWLAPRVQREIDAMSCIFDDRVVALYDAGRCGDFLYLAMELVQGLTLRQWMRHPHSLSLALDIMEAVGRGLVAVHDAGIVHRDIKPSNVLLGIDGEIKIADFGLAVRDRRLIGREAAQRASALDCMLTKEDSFVGTAEYAAPEQFLGQLVDARADQFSFCAVLFELLAGRRLLGQGARVAVSGETVAQELAHLGAAVPRRLIEVMQRGLAFDPAQRFVDFRDLVGTLTG